MYTILAIDDDPIVRLTLTRVLRSAGFEVATAPNAAGGLSAAARLKPDAVILDVHLPDGDGVSVCGRMKSEAALRHIPVLMLTGDAVSLDDQQAGLEAGADDYLLKPFEPQELLLRLRRLLVPPGRKA